MCNFVLYRLSPATFRIFHTRNTLAVHCTAHIRMVILSNSTILAESCVLTLCSKLIAVEKIYKTTQKRNSEQKTDHKKKMCRKKRHQHSNQFAWQL